MQRLHLVELEDLPWIPHPVRDGSRDVLDLFFARIGFYRRFLANLRRLVALTGERLLVDLCSGGGGGALAMWALLDEADRRDLRLVLSDRFPDAAAIARVDALGDPRVRYHPRPVDALAVPREFRGIRTMYTALHHFRPDDVKRLLQGAVAERAPLAFFDLAASPQLRRMPLALAPLACLVSGAALFPVPLLLTPLVRPFGWSRVAFTYALPAIPTVFAWDGAISAIRAYTPDELLALARSVPGADDYAWEVTRDGLALCLTGAPRRARVPSPRDAGA